MGTRRFLLYFLLALTGVLTCCCDTDRSLEALVLAIHPHTVLPGAATAVSRPHAALTGLAPCMLGSLEGDASDSVSKGKHG